MIFIASCLTLLPNLPQKYIKIFSLGEGSAGMVTSFIQVICLGIGGNSKTSGLVYFGTAVVIYATSLTMYANSRRSTFFRHYVNETKDVNNKPIQMLKPTLQSFKIAFSEVWPVITIFGCCLVGQSLDSIGGLVVSEFRNDGTAWGGKWIQYITS